MQHMLDIVIVFQNPTNGYWEKIENFGSGPTPKH